MTLHNHTQAGVVLINLQGYLIGYGWVWFLERGISNILALTNVKTRYRVLSQDENDFAVHSDDREEPLCFKESEHGLYYMDTMEQRVTLVQTVKDN